MTSSCSRTTSPGPHAERDPHVLAERGHGRRPAAQAASFLSRDPRAFGGSTNSNTDVAGVYIVDAKDPADLKLITFKQLPTGHTTSCVNDCEFLWTGGPASIARPSAPTSAGPAGRRSS